MKKALSIIAGMSMLLSLVSCSEAAEKPSAESQVETVDYTTLDSSWECDYFKIGTNSHWESSDSVTDYSTSVTFDVPGGFGPVWLNILKSNSYKKASENELISEWQQKRDDMLTDKLFKDDTTIKEYYEPYSVEDTFVKKSQAYISLTSDDEHTTNRIEFERDGIYGSFSFYEQDRAVVIKMIDSIVFY